MSKFWQLCTKSTRPRKEKMSIFVTSESHRLVVGYNTVELSKEGKKENPKEGN